MAKRKVLLLQPEKCVDCRSCQLACSLSNEGVFSPSKSCISVLTSDLKFSVPLTCLQCQEPACAMVCTTGALYTNPDTGRVDYDKSKCIGCRLCVAACPFGNISYSTEAQKVLKCNTCNGDPECAKVCPSGAISWVDEDLETVARKKAISEKFMKAFGMEV